jgi:hypothetical protein
MNFYKIYFYDEKIKDSYPLTISKKDINDLCMWLNSYTSRWHLEVVEGYLLDSSYNYIGEINFLPSEINNQYFFATYPHRLLAYHEFLNGV